ncbi:hypothetical protein TG1_35 [Streptomyces phage TG1]|uniref:Uncharacterized protein n=1 Tax=Streptomyces phage TG1 TaxID=2927987 RepID=K4I345_9CAUD|nr:hypothetical protein D281_gp35 [Streptomyces phage TG1]AFU62230.1 hypothetical protein TG1_35 [Streptomyces phage TG1]
MQITQETKAVLNAERGRVVGFVKSTEPRKISLAVPADRAVMTPAQARQLAAWLVEEADRVERLSTTPTTSAQWRTAERERQAEIRRALGAQYVGTRRV